MDSLADAVDVFKTSSKNIVGSYKDIKRAVKNLGIKDMEVHHLIEKRFASTLGLNSSAGVIMIYDSSNNRVLYWNARIVH